MDESKNNDHHYLDDDDDDDSDYGDINNSIQTNNNINKAPSAFAPSDLSIGGIAIDTSLSSHCNSVILREKVVIVGDESVGKTSLVRSFLSLSHSHSHSHHQGMEGKFKSRTSSTGRYIRDEDYQMTVGIDWNVKQVPIPTSIMNNNNNNNNNTNNREDVNIKTNRNINKNITVDLFLFDVGGQSIFNQRGLSSRFYKNCSYIICVFDVSSRKSLKSCDTWIQAVKSSLQRQGQEQQQQQEEVARTILVANKVDLRDVSLFILGHT